MTQTNAQRLADEYRPSMGHNTLHGWAADAASELRSMDAENAQLRAQLEVAQAAAKAAVSKAEWQAATNTELNQLRAELERLQKESEAVRRDAWQPIETAPKDGTQCWVLVDGKVCRAFYVEIGFKETRDSEGRYIDQTDSDEYWMDIETGDELEPTMYQPLVAPRPPIGAAQAERAKGDTP